VGFGLVTKEEILEEWMLHWGDLSPELRRRFLARPELKELIKFPDFRVEILLAKYQKLQKIVAELKTGSSRTGQSWTEQEDRALAESLCNWLSFGQMAWMHARSKKDLQLRIRLLLKNGVIDGPEAELAAESRQAYDLRAFSENPPREGDSSDPRKTDPRPRIAGNYLDSSFGEQLDDEANDRDGYDLYRDESSLWDSAEPDEESPPELGEDDD